MKTFKMHPIVLKCADNNEKKKKIGFMQSNLWDISCSTRNERRASKYKNKYNYDSISLRFPKDRMASI